MNESSRDELLLGLRPTLPSAITSGSLSKNEYFQNLTLRPILKFQHELIMALVKSYIANFNPNFYEENSEKRGAFLKATLAKNTALRKQLVGLTLGLMTSDEILLFLKNQNEFTKRILQMCTQRVLDSMPQLEL
ncbi:MAG: hypothetical protein AB8F74_00165 [Saprospiraceae bacterium]